MLVFSLTKEEMPYLALNCFPLFLCHCRQSYVTVYVMLSVLILRLVLNESTMHHHETAHSFFELFHAPGNVVTIASLYEMIAGLIKQIIFPRNTNAALPVVQLAS